MKSNILILLLILSFSTSRELHAQQSTHAHDSSPDTVKKSISREVTARIGDANLTVQYHSPAVRGRTIWGGLVPYGEVWVTGAHSATKLTLDKAILVNNTSIAPGTYAIFTIPGKDQWIVIINRNWNQHLADNYKSGDDILRVQVKAESNEIEERLTYGIEPDNDQKGGKIRMAWEKIKITVPFKIK